jgi:hypothetical protein
MTSDKSIILIRVEPKTKEAIAKAAADEQRSVSNLIERFITEWLRYKGYLPEAKKWGPMDRGPSTPKAKRKK